MFFEVHSEKKIGIKKLSLNDLGLKETGHQTHIGLYQHVLDFLPDNHVEKAAILIYDDYCEILNCDYGKISRSTGKIEAPNIKSGSRNEMTIVNQIRTFASKKQGCEWYLVWFGLQSEELVFWLIASDSTDYQCARKIFPTPNKVYDEHSISFSLAIEFLEKKVNGVSVKSYRAQPKAFTLLLASGKQCHRDSICINNNILQNLGGNDALFLCCLLVGFVNSLSERLQ